MVLTPAAKSLRIGFVSTRFHGTDGVTLETRKWAAVMERLGHTCCYFAGSSDQPVERSYLVPEALFSYPEVRQVYDLAFSRDNRPVEVTRQVELLKDHLKAQVVQFVSKFEVDVLVVENALAIPMNIPLGLALTEFIAETGFPTIAHHHDFYWERDRFLKNCVSDYLAMAFPPHLPTIQHVVINSLAASQLGYRTGNSSLIVPNVMDFEQPPGGPDPYARGLREALRIEPQDKLFLQPTRIVQRKGIEHAIELTKRTGLKARLVISHASGDERDDYENRIREYAALLGVSVNFVSDIVRGQRGLTTDGRKVYSLEDVYLQADLVTYPSTVEGFGNAFLEAIYFKRPIVVNNYSIYDLDIKPRGFRAIEFEGYITDATVQQTRQVLDSPSLAEEMVEHNYRLGLRYFSFRTLEHHLKTLLAHSFGASNDV